MCSGLLSGQEDASDHHVTRAPLIIISRAVAPGSDNVLGRRLPSLSLSEHRGAPAVAAAPHDDKSVDHRKSQTTVSTDLAVAYSARVGGHDGGAVELSCGTSREEGGEEKEVVQRSDECTETNVRDWMTNVGDTFPTLPAAAPGGGERTISSGKGRIASNERNWLRTGGAHEPSDPRYKRDCGERNGITVKPSANDGAWMGGGILPSALIDEGCSCEIRPCALGAAPDDR